MVMQMSLRTGLIIISILIRYYSSMLAFVYAEESQLCSRELSRQVRYILERDVLRSLPSPVPDECILNPDSDKFRLQEKMKREVTRSDWQVLLINIPLDLVPFNEICSANFAINTL